jgi:hypothetical protein
MRCENTHAMKRGLAAVLCLLKLPVSCRARPFGRRGVWATYTKSSTYAAGSSGMCDNAVMRPASPRPMNTAWSGERATPASARRERPPGRDAGPGPAACTALQQRPRGLHPAAPVSVYVDYAVANGIIKSGAYADYTANATRPSSPSIWPTPAGERPGGDQPGDRRAIPDVPASAPTPRRSICCTAPASPHRQRLCRHLHAGSTIQRSPCRHRHPDGRTNPCGSPSP